MYITNNPLIALIAERNGVDRIWIDLEVRGKEARQHNLDTVKSRHTLDDISKMRENLNKARLLVRVNPLYENSKKEIDEVIIRGAEIVMLPMLSTEDDAKRFVEMVGGRAKVLLLTETISAEKNINAIASVPGVDEIHIGLNDLHLQYGMKFMFELLANGHVDYMAQRISAHNIPFGFGGIARLNEGVLPARLIIAEHYRLRSSMAILSRSFCNYENESNYMEIDQKFYKGIQEIRNYENTLLTVDDCFYLENHLAVKNTVKDILRANNL